MSQMNLIFGLIVLIIIVMTLGISAYELYKRGLRFLSVFLGILAFIALLAVIFAVLFLLWAWFYYATGGH